jgi:hypothetical protein
MVTELLEARTQIKFSIPEPSKEFGAQYDARIRTLVNHNPGVHGIKCNGYDGRWHYTVSVGSKTTESAVAEQLMEIFSTDIFGGF